MEKKKKNLRLSTMQILAAGFFGTIFIGGVLLWLPICNTQPIRFLDALFTSTTAVCVTGLVVITPAVQFTMIGKAILLVLIQIGGLGVIACTVSFFLIVKKRITVRERVLIQETYNMDSLSGMVMLIIKILKGTFLVEGLGALFFSFQFVPQFGFIRGTWYAVFHSISSFCNAGIDIIGNSSFTQYVSNPLVNLTTMTLIVAGGIGFTVWSDVHQNMLKVYKRQMPFSKIFTRLHLHSKIAISMTLILIAVGTVLVFAIEYNNPETIGKLPFGEKLLASSFHSVSTRTAGFATVSQGGLHQGTKMISCLLMFIGGSPGGTAGGIKTTTMAMLVLTCLSVIRGGRDTECFGRKIPLENFRTGFSVVVVAFFFLTTGTLLITIFEGNVPFLDVLYETTSAIGTVGLTADLTPTLSSASRIVIMMLMYIGRIGPITMALAFGGKGNAKDKYRELPEKRIMVG